MPPFYSAFASVGTLILGKATWLWTNSKVHSGVLVELARPRNRSLRKLSEIPAKLWESWAGLQDVPGGSSWSCHYLQGNILAELSKYLESGEALDVNFDLLLRSGTPCAGLDQDRKLN